MEAGQVSGLREAFQRETGYEMVVTGANPQEGPMPGKAGGSTTWLLGG